MSRDEGALAALLDSLARLGDEQDAVSVGRIRETVGDRSFGPFLLVPALVEVSPVGSIPGVPTILAAVIILFAVQILVGRDHLWLPGFIERRELNGGKLAAGMRKVLPVARWADRIVRPRLRWLTRRPWSSVAALACVALAATTPLLEVVPFASTVPMAGVALIGLALLTRDGVVLMLAAALSLAGLAGLGVSLLPQ